MCFERNGIFLGSGELLSLDCLSLICWLRRSDETDNARDMKNRVVGGILILARKARRGSESLRFGVGWSGCVVGFWNGRERGGCY